MAAKRFNSADADFSPIDNDAMWAAPSDTDIHEMQALEGAPYVPNPEGNPYAQVDQTQYITTPAATTDPLAAEPQTYQNAAANPVPSPPQQNPYIPGGTYQGADEKGTTAQQPALKRPRAQRKRVNARYEATSSADTNQQQAPATQNAGQGKQPRAPRAHKPAKHGILSFFLWLIMLGTYALLSLRLLPADYATGRLVPELASFIPLALIPAAICFVLALLWHRRFLVLVSFIALAANIVWHAGYFIPTQRVTVAAQNAVLSSSDTSDNAARIMTVNTLHGAAASADIVRICREQNVEVLCLQEMTDSMVQDLINAGIEEVLPYSLISDAATSISNGGRNAIYTKAPMSNISSNLLPIDTSSMPAADITIGNQTVRFVSVHPNSPVRGAQDLWDEGLSIIGSLSQYNHSYVVMGDFNSTWDHVRFRELLGDTFVDAGEQSGEGFHMSYPSNMQIPLSGISISVPSIIEIDHIVYSKNSGITISSLETVNIGGTDHRALLATLEAN